MSRLTARWSKRNTLPIVIEQLAASSDYVEAP